MFKAFSNLSIWPYLVTIGFALSAGNLFGGTGAHGGDVFSDDDNVWNLKEVGDTTSRVEYCIVRDPQSPPLVDLEKKIEDAIAQWQAFFRKYGLDTKVFPNFFADGKQRMILTDFQYHPEGCQDLKRQVAFFFGNKQHPLLQADPFLTEDVLGVARIQKPYDHASYRNGGVIWIAPWTYRPEHLELMVLHELGHIFGMPHNSMAVMSDGLANLIKKKALGLAPGIESPSWKWQLLPGDTLDFTDTRSKETGCPQGGMPVSESYFGPYKEFFSLFRLPVDSCYLSKLQYMGTRQDKPCLAGARSCLALRWLVYTVEVDGHLSERGYVDGVFARSLSDNYMGPSLYTSWLVERSVGGHPTLQPKMGRIYLMQDKSPSIIPAEGYFAIPAAPGTLGTHGAAEYRWAATLSLAPMPRLGVFFPRDGLWLVERNYSDLPPTGNPNGW